jgi:hypothetical protein
MDARVLTNGRSALNPDFPRGRALRSGLRPIPLQGNAISDFTEKCRASDFRAGGQTEWKHT